MSELKLPLIYNKILFWQRLIWLVSIAVLVISTIRTLGQYGNFASNTSSFEMKYFLTWLLGLVAWGACLVFIIHLKRAINIGKEYEAQRSGANFRVWIKASQKTLVYLTLFIVLFTVQIFFNQVLLGVFNL